MAEQQLLNHKQEEETKGEAGEQREPQPGGASVSVPSALTGAGSLRRASASLRERPGACPATLPGAFALNKGRRREEQGVTTGPGLPAGAAPAEQASAPGAISARPA